MGRAGQFPIIMRSHLSESRFSVTFVESVHRDRGEPRVSFN
jgi:hypothetical protein